MLSPLRYPGGKSDFAPTIATILERCKLQNKSICEPFAGSAAVSLYLLDAEVVSFAHLSEKDPLVFSFWYAILNHFDEFVERFLNLPISLDTWKNFRPLMKIEKPDSTNIIDLGVACLFYNRTNFSGILGAGPIGGMNQTSSYPIDCRTNKDEIISRLLSIAMLANRITVEFSDAKDTIAKHGSTDGQLLYVDPPYFEKGELLYRRYYRLADHKSLARELSSCSAPWILSYDDHHVIEFLYSDHNVQRVKFRYSAHSPKNHDELVITNFRIPFEPIVSRQVRS